MRAVMRGRVGSRALALCLVAAGLWLILVGLGLRVPSLARAWPALLVGLGIAMLAEAAYGARGLLFLGMVTALCGGFLLLFSMGAWGLGWSSMAALWPVFPVIIALAVLIMYLVGGMRERGLLFPIMLIGGVGIAALPLTVGVMTRWYTLEVLRFWPLLAGLAILALLFGHADRD
jgi:hypothetical protein